MNKTSPIVEERINSLLEQMSIEEKIGQLNQLHPAKPIDPDTLRKGQVGSILNATGALTGQGASESSDCASLNILQRYAVQESRLGIPLLFGRDVIHGYRTVFPIPLGLAAAFNPALTEKAHSIAAKEASADGIKWTFAPMVDLARDPRWGRVSEGAGEDPYLGSLQAEAAVRGFQGSNYSAPDRLVACAKHFAGYGAAEGGRDYDSAEISILTMRQFYLPPFHAAVRAGVGTLMSAFHDLSGIPMTAHRQLLTNILRGEWGFEGFVVSDWESIAELVEHGYAPDRAQAAELALRAGVDMDMVSGAYLDNLGASLQAGRIKAQDVDEAVRRILRIKLSAGLFDNPCTDESRPGRDILTSDHRTAARQAAVQSMVLLKNSGVLPIDDRFKRVLIAGPLIHAQGDLLGSWAPDGRETDTLPLSQALQDAAPEGINLTFAVNSDEALWRSYDCDLAVVVVGEHPLRSGENNNVAHLELPPGQNEIVRTLSNQGIPIVLVVIAGRPLAVPMESATSEAVLYVFHPGTEGGSALAQVLFGVEEPGGRLPISMPRSTGQVPIYYNHKPSGRPIGSKTWKRRYVDLAEGPLYPFGFGIGYTNFTYSNLMVSHGTDEYLISASISNIGSRAGSEVVQLYVRDLVGQVTRPVKELKGFQRIHMQPGETRQVKFHLKYDDLAFYGRDERLVVEPGQFSVWVGPSSAQGLQGSFVV